MRFPVLKYSPRRHELCRASGGAALFRRAAHREVPFYSQRHLVEPGLTGWAQVNYGYGSTVEDAVQKLQYDLYYIKNETLLLDLWVILKSLKIVFIGRGR
jgi:lipopolysaccharide/colanic/teichoic acid biosynthesis glycosyltransferase